MTQVSNVLIRRATSVVFGVCLFLSVGGLSADSRPAPAGGFLYSQYLKHASAVGDSSLSGSFVVKTNTSALAKKQNRVWNAVSGKINTLSVNKWALGYLFDKEADIARGFQKTVGETGWQLADIVLDESLLAATEGARASGAIRTADFSIESSLGGRKGNVAVDLLGALRETEKEAIAWQFRAYKGEEEAAGGNVGLIYRWVAKNNALLGVNAFLDYETHDVEDFWHWLVGGEVRSPWVDVYANYYDAITDPATEINSEGLFDKFYSASGYDVELNVHSPRHAWLIGSATYYVWEGEFGDKDDKGVRFGLKLAPTNTPVEVKMEYENGDDDDDWGGRISYTHHFGEHQTAAASSAAFNPQDYFFTPTKREYTQRIRTAKNITVTVDTLPPATVTSECALTLSAGVIATATLTVAQVFSQATGDFGPSGFDTAQLITNVAAFLNRLNIPGNEGSSYALWKLRDDASGVFGGEFTNGDSVSDLVSGNLIWNINASPVPIPIPIYSQGFPKHRPDHNLETLQPGDVVGLAAAGTITNDSEHVYRIYTNGMMDNSTPRVLHFYFAAGERTEDRKYIDISGGFYMPGDGEFFLNNVFNQTEEISESRVLECLLS